MVTPSWVSTPTQPIALDDVARYLAGVCGNEAAYGEGYDTGGPEVMTYRQMIERIAALLGRKPLIVEVPVLTPYLSSLWLNLVTPVSGTVARPLVEGLRNPTIAREERIRKLLPLELTLFDEAVRRVLPELRGHLAGSSCPTRRAIWPRRPRACWLTGSAGRYTREFRSSLTAAIGAEALTAPPDFSSTSPPVFRTSSQPSRRSSRSPSASSADTLYRSLARSFGRAAGAKPS